MQSLSESSGASNAPLRWASPGVENSSSGTHVASCGEGAHVEVPSNEVNFVPHHVGMETTQKGCRCVTFLGDFVVDVNRAKRA